MRPLPRTSVLSASVLSMGMAALVAGGCHASSALEQLPRARQLSAEMTIQFAAAADATNRAVMAESDEASETYAREAEQATSAVHAHAEALGLALQALDYREEMGLADQFKTRFADYDALQRRILELAVENTNVKAQRLSFGPAAEAAESMRAALASVTQPSTLPNRWQIESLAMTAIAAVREIQVLQAAHIASADDAAMARMEERMEASQKTAQRALSTLAPLVQPASRPALAKAAAQLDPFLAANRQILALSRRNTNVRSLALTLNEKGKLTAACEASLTALRDRLGQRDLPATR